MRKHGNISDVIFISQGWDIYNLATKYKLSLDGAVKFIYVNTMAELRSEISKAKIEYNEQRQTI